jgi:hypothetical protein
LKGKKKKPYLQKRSMLMSKAQRIEQVEKDGYQGTVYQNDERDTQFVSWLLATFSADHGAPVKVTGVTGRNGSPKAAAWNLAHGQNAFLQRVLRSRIQLGREGSSILVSVPGAAIQGVGYDEPLVLNLEERLASSADLNLALSVMANTIAGVTSPRSSSSTSPKV